MSSTDQNPAGAPDPVPPAPVAATPPPAAPAAAAAAVTPDVPPGPGSLWSKLGLTARSAVVGAAGVVAAVGALSAPSSLSVGASGLDTINGCGLEGSASPSQWQWTANPLKNRSDIPSAETDDATVTLSGLMAGTDAAFDQTRSATISGYITHVKVGGTESCNCGTSDPQYMDTHIYVGAQANAPDSKCVIVEVTPRIRQIMAAQGVDWSSNALIASLPGHQVQIGGWLFYDKEHFPAAANNPAHGSLVWRASCWELHPVTSIEVLASPGSSGTATSTPPSSTP